MDEQIRIRAAVILVQDEEILLVRHQKGRDTYWLLPGGGVEYGETATEAARREVTEETGLEVEVGDLALVAETLAPDSSRHLLHLVFRGHLRGGRLQVGREARLAEARFVPLATLPEMDLHPPMAAEVLRVARSTGATACYLGALWCD